MILPLLLALQTTPVAPIERGTALPPPASEEGQVLAPVQRLFDALAARNPQAILAEVRPDGRATAVDEKPDGTRAITTNDWPSFAQRLATPGPRLNERLTGTPAVEIDGDIAMVWSGYTFTIDGKLSHCGTDHVGLIRENNRWKILNLTWTKRTTGCAQ
ncbi:nuclear transport factor 2 family protein [Sphingomonas radiodurans]|uniref:nuclear transport factor 2 family protein n=1 Tax=Sphingomonas radiodurans TaxID=2890321 RepID=UPI001E5B942C|nr:nuclear transport factor 2 family protein [Sphingomonas radiodurans]WBH17270.1 nuclear transport factor 2 family protein [Sphingomonas radiodurans]